MNEKKWPPMGDVILVQDQPTTDAQRELWANRQPPTKKGEVVEVPTGDSSGFLVIDVGGEYGGVTYAARDFPSRYTWKPFMGRVDTGQSLPSKADVLVKAIRGRVQKGQAAGLTQEQANEVLMELREAVRRNEGSRISPQYRAVLNAFQRLDKSLTAGFEHPSDWE